MSDNLFKYYIHGESYFNDLYSLLIIAQNEILIAGWWVTPYVYLKRNISVNESETHYRFDVVLKRILDEKPDLRVHIIMWKNHPLIQNNSDFNLDYFTNLHRNITVKRDSALGSKLFYSEITTPWTHHQKFVIIDRQIMFLGGIDIAYGRWDNSNHRLVDLEKRSFSIFPMRELVFNHQWKGIDYLNEGLNEYLVDQVSSPNSDVLNRSTQTRMPWHDIHCVLTNIKTIRFAVKLFSDRWKRGDYNLKDLNLEDIDLNKNILNLLLPKELINSMSSISTQPEIILSYPRKLSEGKTITETDSSILKRYLTMIRFAKDSIYIENQYFIDVNNGVSLAIKERLETEFEELSSNPQKTQFLKVLVLVPSTPTGNFLDNSTTQKVVSNQIKTINQLLFSLDTSLRHFGLMKYKVEDFIFFGCLRKLEYFDKIPITDKIYIHSKLMIVDSNQLIIGSANINDRSLLGDRDTEICVYLSDTNICTSLLNSLLMEHTRIGSIIFSKEKWYIMIQNAHKNQDVYNQIFRSIESNFIKGDINNDAYQRFINFMWVLPWLVARVQSDVIRFMLSTLLPNADPIYRAISQTWTLLYNKYLHDPRILLKGTIKDSQRVDELFINTYPTLYDNFFKIPDLESLNKSHMIPYSLELLDNSHAVIPKHWVNNASKFAETFLGNLSSIISTVAPLPFDELLKIINAIFE